LVIDSRWIIAIKRMISKLWKTRSIGRKCWERERMVEINQVGEKEKKMGSELKLTFEKSFK